MAIFRLKMEDGHKIYGGHMERNIVVELVKTHRILAEFYMRYLEAESPQDRLFWAKLIEAEEEKIKKLHESNVNYG